jgi:hypothetical protein
VELLIIWGFALLFYACFWCWYVGFRKKIPAEEVDEIMVFFNSHDSMHDSMSEKRKMSLQKFFSNDDGKDFVMVNLLDLAKPRRESSKKLAAYQKVFLGALLRKAGHPVFVATAASGNIENVACEHADDWSAAAMVRYRSRRDLLEILPETFGSEHHALKLASLDKTFAFPAAPWFIFGGPRIVMALATALVAAVVQCIIV